MSLRDIVRKVFPDLWDFGVSVVSDHLQRRPRRSEPEREKEPELLTDEELDQIAHASFDDYIRALDVGEEFYDVDLGPQEEEVSSIEEGKSFEGQSALEYCIECAVKHSQTAKILMREALQRAEARDPGTPGVQEKVRGVTEELCGLEDDTTTVENKRVTALNTMARELRKYIYTTGAEMGQASIDELGNIKGMVDKLVEASYLVRAAEECPTCEVDESLITPK